MIVLNLKLLHFDLVHLQKIRINELLKHQIFDKTAMYVYVIKHQKSGLPHNHFLIILQRDWSIYTLKIFNKIILVDISNKTTNYLHKIVLRNMM